MIAFAPSTALSATKPALTTSFVTAIPSHRTNVSGPTMTLSPTIRFSTIKSGSLYGGVGELLKKAESYMAKSVTKQYLNLSNPTGVYSVSCTEGSVKFAAEVARVRALNTAFRATQVSVAKKYGDMYENRKNAIVASHECSHEEGQFCDYNGVAAAYNLSKAETYGTCDRYATPESVEESAMMRYMDIQQGIAANPSGVYSPSCNEGSVKGAAEDLRISALNVAFRNGQKPLGQLLQEKYNQKAAGYAACHNCSYEEELVSKYPAIGAAFRPKTYGF